MFSKNDRVIVILRNEDSNIKIGDKGTVVYVHKSGNMNVRIDGLYPIRFSPLALEHER